MSETGNFESEFDKLLAEEEDRRLRAEATGFACRFLMDRGVLIYDYSLPDARPPEPSLEGAETDEDIAKQILSHTKELAANVSATTEVLVAVALIKKGRELGKADPEAKKRLQARLMAEGRDQAYVELVDGVLDGEPLGPNDAVIFQEAVLAATERDVRQVVVGAETQVKLQAAGDLIDNKLEEAGLTDDDISPKTIAAFFELVNLYVFHEDQKEFMQGQPVASKIEAARKILNTWEISDQRWIQVIQQLFG